MYVDGDKYLSDSHQKHIIRYISTIEWGLKCQFDMKMCLGP